MKAKTTERYVATYIAARRTERYLDHTRSLARQWHGRVGQASQQGDDTLAVQALRWTQLYRDSAEDLGQLLAEQEAALQGLAVVGHGE